MCHLHHHKNSFPSPVPHTHNLKNSFSSPVPPQELKSISCLGIEILLNLGIHVNKRIFKSLTPNDANKIDLGYALHKVASLEKPEVLKVILSLQLNHLLYHYIPVNLLSLHLHQSPITTTQSISYITATQSISCITTPPSISYHYHSIHLLNHYNSIHLLNLYNPNPLLIAHRLCFPVITTEDGLSCRRWNEL